MNSFVVLCVSALVSAAAAGNVREKRGFLNGLGSSGLAADPFRYSASIGYEASSRNYAAPLTGYAAPRYSYAKSSVGYAAPSIGFAPSTLSYSASSIGYTAPAISYAAPALPYSAPSARAVAINKLVNVQREVSVPQVVQVRKLVSEPRLVTIKKVVPAATYSASIIASEYAGGYSPLYSAAAAAPRYTNGW